MTGNSGSLLCCPWKVQSPFQLRGGAGDCSRVTAGQIYLTRLVSSNSVFLSMGDRDLGVAFKVHPWSQAASRVDAKNSALLSTCDRYPLEPIEWLKGSQACCGVLRVDSGLLSRPCRKERLHLVMTGESRDFRAAARRVGFLSIDDGEFREPLVWPHGSPVSIRVERGCAALLSNQGMGLGPQDALKGESRSRS